MAEDVSAQARLALDIAAASSLIMVVLNMMIVAMSFLDNFEFSLITAVQSTKTAALKDLTLAKDSTAANIYKVIVTSDISIDKIEIKRNGAVIKTLTENGASGSNFEYLLKNASKVYKITVTNTNNVYTFELVEVN